MRELAAGTWDVVVVGGGHNGLTGCRVPGPGGPSVLVLERRDQLGGACTLEQPFADARLARQPVRLPGRPACTRWCDELDLRRHGLPGGGGRPAPLVPFPRRHLARPVGRRRSQRRAVARSVAGRRRWLPRLQRPVRPHPPGAARPVPATPGSGASPDRAELAELLAGDPEAIEVLFHASIAEVVERHVRRRAAAHRSARSGPDRHLCRPARPRHRRHPPHACLRRTRGTAGAWGYVDGGMGRVSFALADAAIEAGAVLAAGVPVAAIVPGDGVRLEGGEMIRAAVVVSNADPKRTPVAVRGRRARGLPQPGGAWRSSEPGLQDQLRAVAASALSPAAAGPGQPHRAMVTISSGIDATQAAYEASRPGEPAPPGARCTFTPPTTRRWPRPAATP